MSQAEDGLLVLKSVIDCKKKNQIPAWCFNMTSPYFTHGAVLTRSLNQRTRLSALGSKVINKPQNPGPPVELKEEEEETCICEGNSSVNKRHVVFVQDIEDDLRSRPSCSQFITS